MKSATQKILVGKLVLAVCFFGGGCYAGRIHVSTFDSLGLLKTKLRKSALIFGITGQDGSYLTKFLLEKNYEVFGVVRRSSTDNNLVRLERILKDMFLDHMHLLYADITDMAGVVRLIQEVVPDEIYNLAAQSHVKVSFEKPLYTAQVDAMGTLNILEAIRIANFSQKTRFYQASTSELFGKVQQIPQNEKTSFYPRSPYGVSKLFSYWAVVNYREAYGLYACNGILFNHESPLRGEDFVSRVITMGVVDVKNGLREKLLVGNLDAKRDWGFAGDYVEAMWLILQQNFPDDFVIATGQTHTVREFIELAFKYVGIEIKWIGSGLTEIGVDAAKPEKVLVAVDPMRFRPAEVDILIGDASKAARILGWVPRTKFPQLVEMMVNNEMLA